MFETTQRYTEGICIDCCRLTSGVNGRCEICGMMQRAYIPQEDIVYTAPAPREYIPEPDKPCIFQGTADKRCGRCAECKDFAK